MSCVSRQRTARLACALAASTALVAAGCGGSAGPGASAARAERISFDDSSCAGGWSAPSAGSYQFTVSNRSSHTASVALLQFGSGIVVTRLSQASPHSASVLSARLHAGAAYQWSCAVAGRAPRLSATAQVPVRGNPRSFPKVAAQVATVQLIQPLSYYRRYVNALLARLHPELAELRAEIARGSLPGAESAWLSAHLTWLRIGEDDGAYGAFGKLGAQIDGTAAGLVGGTSSRRFTGFHRVELDLFRRRDLGAAAGDTEVLSRLVSKLTPHAVAGYLPATTASIGAWTLRAHEILEDALRDSLSGDDDYGSHSDLAAVAADAAATREMLRVLAPLLNPRAPGLTARGDHELAALDRALTAARTDRGGPALRALKRRVRQRIDAATGAAVETLAPVSELMQIGGST